MTKKMTIESAIKKSLQNYNIGDSVSRIRLTEQVFFWRGMTQGGSVSRILRYMQRDGEIEYEKIRAGVFELQAKNWDRKTTALDALNWAVGQI